MQQVPQRLQRTVKLCYQLVLLLYPASFRRQFRNQLSETFDALVHDEFASDSWRGIAASCRMLAHELFICVPSQNLRCIYEVARAGQLRHYWKRAVIGSTVLGVISTPPDLASTLVVATGFASIFWLLTAVFRRDPSALTVKVEL